MGYYVEWQGKDATRAYWRGFNTAERKQREYNRGFHEGKRAVLRGILRCVQIAIMVAAVLVIIRGYDSIVTVPVIAER